MLNERKDEWLTAKFSQEDQALHLLREDLQLKKQLLQKFEESDKRLQENLNSSNAIMSNIGVAIQQSIAIQEFEESDKRLQENSIVPTQSCLIKVLQFSKV